VIRKMEKKQVVYLLTSGEYSDYQVHAVLSAKKGKEFAVTQKQLGKEEYRLEKFIVDDINKWNISIRVQMYRTGDVRNIEGFISIPSHPSYFAGFYKVYFPVEHNGEYCLSYVVATDDEERAIKVVNEKRTQILAHDAWGNDEIVKQLGI